MLTENVSVLSPGQKAQKTARWARTMTKWLITHSKSSGAKWRLIEFGGITGSESYGIVDILAIRKDHRPKNKKVKRGDLFEIVLIQTKGGRSKFPSGSDIERMIAVAKHHNARDIVLAEWKLKTRLQLHRLVGRTWQLCKPADVF
jgi:hypothetical protein